MGRNEDRKDADVDESDDGCNAPLDTGGGRPVGDDNREAIYDELQYEMDLSGQHGRSTAGKRIPTSRAQKSTVRTDTLAHSCCNGE